jgi:hypothetical protein
LQLAMPPTDRDTVIQACFVMLQAANAQNNELRKTIAELRAERAEMVKYVKSVDGLGDKVAEIVNELKEKEDNWILLTQAILKVSAHVGLPSPLDMEVTVHTVEAATVPAATVPAGTPASFAVPVSPPAPVDGAALGRELYDKSPGEVLGVADENMSSSDSMPDLVSASDSSNDGDA